MSTMKRFGMMTMILGGALAAFGCSAPGSSGGGPLAQGDGGSLSNPFHQGSTPGTPQSPTGPAGASVTPKSFCTDLDAWLTKCGTTPAAGSEAACEQSYQKYTASQLTASEGCFKQITTCDSTALSQCLKDAVASGGTTPTTPTTPSNQTCDQCVTAKCSAEVAGCKANPDCVTLYTCLQSAKTQADAQACEDQSPNGVTDLQTFAQCVTGPCGSVCK
jgi:hypothetical protein